MMRGQPGLGEWVTLLSFVAALIVGVTEFIVVPWVVVGPSMSPALEPGDHVLIDRWTYSHRAPWPGEVVLFLAPDSGAPLVKRVCGSPRGGTRERDASGGVWVEGDNAPNSVDSRQFGPVAMGQFRGRILWRYWPLPRAGPVR